MHGLPPTVTFRGLSEIIMAKKIIKKTPTVSTPAAVKKQKPPHTDDHSSAPAYKLLVCVVLPRLEKTLIETLTASGARYATHFVAEGSAAKEVLDLFGLADNKRSVLFAFAAAQDLEKIKAALHGIYCKHGAGICLVINIDAFIGVSSVFSEYMAQLEVENE